MLNSVISVFLLFILGLSIEPIAGLRLSVDSASRFVTGNFVPVQWGRDPTDPVPFFLRVRPLTGGSNGDFKFYRINATAEEATGSELVQIVPAGSFVIDAFRTQTADSTPIASSNQFAVVVDEPTTTRLSTAPIPTLFPSPTASPGPKHSKPPVGAIVAGMIVGVVGVILLVVLFLPVYRRRQARRNAHVENGTGLSPDPFSRAKRSRFQLRLSRFRFSPPSPPVTPFLPHFEKQTPSRQLSQRSEESYRDDKAREYFERREMLALPQPIHMHHDVVIPTELTNVEPRRPGPRALPSIPPHSGPAPSWPSEKIEKVAGPSRIDGPSADSSSQWPPDKSRAVPPDPPRNPLQYPLEKLDIRTEVPNPEPLADSLAGRQYLRARLQALGLATSSDLPLIADALGVGAEPNGNMSPVSVAYLPAYESRRSNLPM